jgi:fructose-1,6-bisphosphatase/inositol monophosphatase family enzyme
MVNLQALNELVREVGIALIQVRQTLGADGLWNGGQFKSKADLFAHARLCEGLSLIAPDIPILSEEGDQSLFDVRPNIYWLIDPIDGTASYAEGFKGWVTQVCLIKNNIPILASIYAPELDELYCAETSKGAWYNNVKITNMPVDKTNLTLTDNYPTLSGISRHMYENLGVKNYLESGSLSLKALNVIIGKADIFVKDVLVKDWDFAAPMVIASEIGTYLSLLNGSPFIFQGEVAKKGIIVTRSTELHQKIISESKRFYSIN